MDSDFWQRVDRLEELAKKAANEDVIAFIPTDKSYHNQAMFINAANPAMILEMCAEMRRLEKEADWLAEKACKCSFAYRNRSCHHLCVGNCSICLYDNRIVTAQDFREAARKAMESK